MEIIGTTAAILQLLEVAAKFVKLYDAFCNAGLVHANNQHAIGMVSQVRFLPTAVTEYVRNAKLIHRL